jgi:hypothetical protein
VSESDSIIAPNWQTEIAVTTLGIWGHDAYTELFRYSGCKGKYPEYEYRFTRFGDASIYADKFADVFFKKDELYSGFSNALYKIVYIRQMKTEQPNQ